MLAVTKWQECVRQRAQSMFSTRSSPRSKFSPHTLPKRVVFLYKNLPKKSYFRGKFNKSLPKTVFGSVAPGGWGRARGANLPTLANHAISGTFLTQNGQKHDFSGVKLEIYRTLEGTGVLPALSAVGFYET